MAYLDRLLAPGERVVVRKRRHVVVLVRRLGAAGFVTLAGLLLAIYVGGVGRFAEPARVWAWGGVAIAVVGLLGALPAWWRWRNEEFLVTDRRVIQIEGILAKQVLDSNLERSMTCASPSRSPAGCSVTAPSRSSPPATPASTG